MKAIIFDMDGVMYDTEKLATNGWLYAAKQMNFSLTIDDCNSFKGSKTV